MKLYKEYLQELKVGMPGGYGEDFIRKANLYFAKLNNTARHYSAVGNKSKYTELRNHAISFGDALKSKDHGRMSKLMAEVRL